MCKQQTDRSLEPLMNQQNDTTISRVFFLLPLLSLIYLSLINLSSFAS